MSENRWPSLAPMAENKRNRKTREARPAMAISLYDLKDKVRRVEDLRGRVLGIHSNSLTSSTTGQQFLVLVLRQHGVSPESVRFVAAGQSWDTQASAMRAQVADAIVSLKALDPAEVNGFEGQDMAFVMGSMRMPFTAEGFLMSFSLPNLHFHATTAYDILRMQGVPLGKRDYLGGLRLKS